MIPVELNWMCLNQNNDDNNNNNEFKFQISNFWFQLIAYKSFKTDACNQNQNVRKQKIKRQQRQHSITIYNLLAFGCVCQWENCAKWIRINNKWTCFYSENLITFRFISFHSIFIKCNKFQYYHDGKWLEMEKKSLVCFLNVTIDSTKNTFEKVKDQMDMANTVWIYACGWFKTSI